MNLLILTRYDQQGASSRVRFMQYAPYLQAVGFNITLRSLFPDSYLQALYAGRTTKGTILGGYRRRLKELRAARSGYGVVWLEKEALPWLPWAIEARFLPDKVPVVVDYDDAVFHNYDLHKRAPVRWLLGTKHAQLMTASARVFAGNAYLAEYARVVGAPSVEIIPTVVNTEAYQVSPTAEETEAPVIGWIGSPSTWLLCVVPYGDVLRDVALAFDVNIHAVGARPDADRDGPFQFLPWNEESEIERIQAMDIGIMPLPNTPWMRGKCGYKLIQYMACGLPVVASPVGVNTKIVEHGVNGFLAETPEEWANALKTLIDDPELRQKMGQAGRKRVEERYSLQVYGPRVASLLREIAERGKTAPVPRKV